MGCVKEPDHFNPGKTSSADFEPNLCNIMVSCGVPQELWGVRGSTNLSAKGFGPVGAPLKAATLAEGTFTRDQFRGVMRAASFDGSFQTELAKFCGLLHLVQSLFACSLPEKLEKLRNMLSRFGRELDEQTRSSLRLLAPGGSLRANVGVILATGKEWWELEDFQLFMLSHVTNRKGSGRRERGHGHGPPSKKYKHALMDGEAGLSGAGRQHGKASSHGKVPGPAQKSSPQLRAPTRTVGASRGGSRERNASPWVSEGPIWM